MATPSVICSADLPYDSAYKRYLQEREETTRKTFDRPSYYVTYNKAVKQINKNGDNNENVSKEKDL